MYNSDNYWFVRESFHDGKDKEEESVIESARLITFHRPWDYSTSAAGEGSSNKSNQILPKISCGMDSNAFGLTDDPFDSNSSQTLSSADIQQQKQSLLVINEMRKCRQQMMKFGKSNDIDEVLLTIPPGFRKGLHRSDILALQPAAGKANNDIAGDNLSGEIENDNNFDAVKQLSELNQASVATSQIKPSRTPKTFTDVDNIVEQNLELEKENDEKEATLKKEEEDEQRFGEIDITDVTHFKTLIPRPAIQYPFELDEFQKRAVLRLERGESVFVAAHTSAGKTVVAEYAIALAREHKTKCIYTSPIKALSNQKYRDFVERFGKDDVGLLTGDIQINPKASCLVVTTEILRSKLYRNDAKDLEYVVFDEVHYIRDAERGVVWEEAIIMLPPSVVIIMLSATTPNALEFSRWVGRTKNRCVYVISTPYRPVPLEYFLYAGNKMHKLVDKTGAMIPDAYKAARAAADDKDDNKPGQKQIKPTASSSHHHKPKNDQNSWLTLVKDMKQKELIPMVAFVFSKAGCEERASSLRSLDLNDASEKHRVAHIFNDAISRLQGTDKDLPQVHKIREYVERGVAVHHSGLLPILKEAVEILFGQGLIKVLFATETFAMGVNMPARTVVFDSLRKHDGEQLRDLLSGEFIQMAGRAGRRGLDTVGTVLIFCKENPPPMEVLTRILKGSPLQLSSSFRLTYVMILNILWVTEITVSEMMKKSFSEFAQQEKVNSSKYNEDVRQARIELRKLSKEFKKMNCVKGCHSEMEKYYNLERDAGIKMAEVIKAIGEDNAKAREVVPLMFCRGRVVLITTQDIDQAFAVLCPAIILSTRHNEGAFEVLILPLNVSSANQSNAAFASGIQGSSSTEGSENDDDSSKTEFTRVKKVAPQQPSQSVKKGKALSGRVDYVVKTLYYFEIHKICNTIVDIPEVSSNAEARSSETASVSRQSSAMEQPGLIPIGKKSGNAKLTQNKRPQQQQQGGSKKGGSGYSALDESYKLCADMLYDSLLQLSEKHSFTNPNFVFLLDELDPRDVKINEIVLHQSFSKANAIHKSIAAFDCNSCAFLGDHFELAHRSSKARRDLAKLLMEGSDERLSHFPDFLARLKVLRRLGYLDEVADDAVQLKGRVACEVNTCDLILVEMVFENVLESLDPAQCAALLSALVLQTKNAGAEGQMEKSIPTVTPTLDVACKKTLKIAQAFEKLQSEAGVTLTTNYIESQLNFGLVEATYRWAMGVSFLEICSITEIEEGTIVRCILRLNETMREVSSIARMIGNPILLQKMEQGMKMIKRDVIFASSLYVN